MKKFSFVVDVVADDLDREVVVDSIRSCLNDALPGDVHSNVKAGEVKALELATGSEKLLVACNGLSGNTDPRYWDPDPRYWDHKIAAIKSIRLATLTGLKDAKDWIEEAVNYKKTVFTKPLDPEVAHRLCDELGKCGCSCWTTNA